MKPSSRWASVASLGVLIAVIVIAFLLWDRSLITSNTPAFIASPGPCSIGPLLLPGADLNTTMPSGGTSKITVGDHVVIEVPANQSVRSVSNSNPATLQLTAEAEQCVGAVVWVYVAREPGTAVVDFHMARPGPDWTATIGVSPG